VIVGFSSSRTGKDEAVSKRLRLLAGLQDVVVRVTEVPIRSMPLLPNWIFETSSRRLYHGRNLATLGSALQGFAKTRCFPTPTYPRS